MKKCAKTVETVENYNLEDIAFNSYIQKLYIKYEELKVDMIGKSTIISAFI